MPALPVLFLERLKEIIPADYETVCETFQHRPPLAFRVNTLKISLSEFQRQWKETGLRAEAVSWYPGAFILREENPRVLQETPLYQRGEIYIQGLSSMLVPLLLDPRPGETILDMAAAPGSKTTQIACLMKGEGKLIANDSNRSRFFKLKTILEAQGARAELSLNPGEIFGRKYPAYFDRILLDAPCSSEGRFCLAAPESFAYWKPAKIKEMAGKQKVLLASAFDALKPGGRLVYSTCTFAPEENEAALDWLMRKRPGLVTVEPAALPIQNVRPGLKTWEGKDFDPQTENSLRVLPDGLMEGFFMAVICKKDGSASIRSPAGMLK